MNPTSEKRRSMDQFYKNLTMEYCKHAVLMDKRTRNQHRNKSAVQQAYKEIANAMGLQSERVVKKKLEQMQNYATGKIRSYFKYSLRVKSIDEAIKKIPDWMKVLEDPFGLIERSYNVLTVDTKSFNSRRYREIRLIIDLMNVIEGRLKHASCPMEASKVLTSPDTILDFADSVNVAVEKLHGLWNNIYQQAKAKLFIYMEEGDCIDEKLAQIIRLTNVDKKAIDLGLLYDVRLRALQKGTSKSQKKLLSVILLFKLVVAAKRKCEILQWERGERSVYKANGGESVEMWSMVYLEYIRRGRWASPILLQRRWHELKQLARYRFLFARKGTQEPPHILLLAIVRRFPYIVTEKLPTWNELVRNNQVFMEWDFHPYQFEPQSLMTVVPEDISEKDLLEELNDSDDDVEIIEKEQEIIEIDDQDDEVAIKKEKDNEIEVNIDLLEKIDPDKAKVRIIFEDDEDVDKELESFKREDEDGDDLNNFNCYKVPIEVTKADDVNTSVGDFAKKENGVDEKLDDFSKLNAVASKVDDNNVIDDTSLLEVREHQGDVNSDDDSDSDEDITSPVLDNKLIQLPRVVLTPLEDIQLWRRHSRNNSLNCRQLSVRKLAGLVFVTSEELDKCRLYKKPMNTNQIVASTLKNGIKRDKMQEINKIYYKFKSKRRLLTKSLKLPRTSFSSTFWTERNIKLLECCQPVSVKLERVARSRKKVELADIDEVRRINKMILTAQVAPLPVEPRVQEKEITVLPEDDDSSDFIRGNNLNNVVEPSEREVKDILRKYCAVINDMKTKDIPEQSTTSEMNDNADLIKNCLDLKAIIDQQISDITDTIYKKKAVPKATKTCLKKGDNSKNNKSNGPNESSIDEWQRQKKQNLQYFNFKPVLKENEKTLKTYNKNCLKRPAETIVTPKRSKVTDDNIKESDNNTEDTNLQDDSDDLIICEPNDINVIELSDNDDDVNEPIETKMNTAGKNININTSNVNVNENLSNVNIGDINKILNFIHKSESDDTKKLTKVNIENKSPHFVIPPFANVTTTNTNAISEQSLTSAHKINIRVVKNCFEINGDQNQASTSQSVGESHNILNLLSKVAYKIQGKKEHSRNPPALLPMKPKNIISKVAIPNYTPPKENPLNNDTVYYVVKVPNKQYVPHRPVMPIIKNVESLSDIDQNKEKKIVDNNVDSGKVGIKLNDSIDSDKDDKAVGRPDNNEVNTDLRIDKPNDVSVKSNSVDDKEIADTDNDGEEPNDDIINLSKDTVEDSEERKLETHLDKGEEKNMTELESADVSSSQVR